MGSVKFHNMIIYPGEFFILGAQYEEGTYYGFSCQETFGNI